MGVKNNNVNPGRLMFLTLAVVLLTGSLNPVLPSAIPDSPKIIPVNSKIIHGISQTNFGAWGPWDMCPDGSFATAGQIKYAGNRVNNPPDQTGLNGIALLCTSANNQFTKIVTSTVGPWGEWLAEPVYCGSWLNGFKLRSYPYNPNYDNLGATNFEMFCPPDHDFAFDPAINYGVWSPIVVCPAGQYINGIQTLVENNDPTVTDHTALNNVNFSCDFPPTRLDLDQEKAHPALRREDKEARKFI